MKSKALQVCPLCENKLDSVFLPNGKKELQCPHCQGKKALSGLHKNLRINDFVLLEKLGSGGMGEVWKARQLSMNRDVALKILSPDLSEDTTFVKGFLNEAVMTGRLQHPNIITAYTAGNASKYYYLATLYVDGIELLDKIKIDGILPEREALNIVRIIASALSYAWEEHHMLHCDIKPGNIMIDRYRMPYLMDMGISKIISEHDSSPNSNMIVGSLQYMSPEQAANNVKLDVRTDIYSLGVTLYQMVTASLPFGNKTVKTSIFQKIEKHLPPPIKRNPYLSEGCAALISQMMSNDREDRQSDWNYVIADIDAVFAGTYVPPKNVKRKKWSSIKAKRRDFNINAPISLGKKNKSKAPKKSNGESSGDTQKITRDPLKAVPQQPPAPPPPVIFDAGKKRHSGLKLLILLIIFGISLIALIVYYALRWLK